LLVGPSSVSRNFERGAKEERVLKSNTGSPRTAGDQEVLRAKPPVSGGMGAEPPAAEGYPMGVWRQSPQPMKKICNFEVKLYPFFCIS